MATGPYMDLPAGRYRIKWWIEADGDNRIRLSCSNDAQITPSEIVIPAGEAQGEAWFDIEEPTHSFSVNVDFLTGTHMTVHSIRLYTPFYKDHAYTFSAVLVLLCILWTLRRTGRLTAQDMRELALLTIAVVFASLLHLGENTPSTHDTHFHAARIMNLADGLHGGQFPVRVGGFSYNGYGAMTSVFYPDLLLYPWALMLLGGASITYVLNSLVVAINVLTAACMLLCARRILRSREAALCASILYVLSIYRLTNIFERYALGEMLAMAFLPIFLLGLYEVMLGDRRRWPVLALGATLIFRSHMLSTVLCALAALVTGLVFLRKILREKRLGAIVLAAAATLLMNLNQLVPMLMCFMAGVNTSVVQFGFVGRALELRELLVPEQYVGLALMIGAAAFCCVETSETERRERHTLNLILAAGGLCALLATDIIPWSHVVKLTGGLVEILQFPWRFLLLTAICLALVGGDGLARLLGEGKHTRAACCTLALALLCAVPYIDGMQPYPGRQIGFGAGAKTYMIWPEYQIQGTDVENTRSRQPILMGDAALTRYEKDGTRVTAQVEAEQGGAVELPMFGFPGYRAMIDGQKAEWTLGTNNRLSVGIPAGARGELRVWYEGYAIWRVMDVISLLSALALGAYVIRRGKRERT